MQDMASEIKESRIYEINNLKSQIKMLNLEIDKLKEEKESFLIIYSQKKQFENEIKHKKKILEQSKDLVHRLHIINLLIAFFGFSVAVNYISKITSENDVATNVYEIPRDIYSRIEKIEFKINFLSVVLLLVLVMQIVLFFKS
ncbi:hypothetical protein [Vibrio spartinae]|nr:hypothetical protein [Vibrio spartinae]